MPAAWSVRLVAGGVLMALLAWACAADLRRRRIPNVLVLTMLATGLALSLAPRTDATPGMLGALRGFALGLVIWLPFHTLGLLGAGDVKLIAAAGAWLGPRL